MAGEPLSLPDSEVSILDSELCKRRALTGGVRAVEGGEFFNEDAGRPAVRDDVMHDQEKHMVLGRETPQCGTQQWAS